MGQGIISRRCIFDLPLGPVLWGCPTMLCHPHVWPQGAAGRDQPGAGGIHSSRTRHPPFAPAVCAAAQQTTPHKQQEMAGGAM